MIVYLNKLMRRLMSVLIIVSMLITGLGMSACFSPAYAASKVKLSSKKITLKVGKKSTLKLRNVRRKVTWKVGNKKILKIVKTSGKRRNVVTFKALKKGKTHVYAKVGKKKYSCLVTVKAKQTSQPDITKPEEPVVREPDTRDLSDSSIDLTALMKADPTSVLEPDENFISAYSDFSIELLKESINQDLNEGKQDNVLISPQSVATALAMTENGADNQTLAEMEQVLGGGIDADSYNQYLSGLNRKLGSSDEMIYNISNSIWARENTVDVKDSFLQTNKNYHDAEFYLAPFNDQTVRDINSWVYNKSRNMIDNILQELSNDSRMVLVNTVAFEGKWADPFNKKATTEKNFTAYDGSVQKASMLHDHDSYQYFKLSGKLKGGQGFVKYYKAGSKSRGVAFVGLLPPEGMGADEYVSMLDGNSFIEGWNSKEMRTVDLSLPKFECDYGIGMKDTLETMGIREAFTDDADFSRMANPTPETEGLKISDVLHKTHIELDEEGTKAAAATAVVMEKAGAAYGEEIITLNFNRPFVYALVDSATGMPLFIGTMKSIN